MARHDIAQHSTAQPSTAQHAITVRFAASFTSADASTNTGFLPPSSRMHGVRCFAAPSATTLPTAGEPVKKILSKRWSSSAPVQPRSPRISEPTTEMTFGSRYLRTSCESSFELASDTLHGLSTTVLPAAMAPSAGTSESWKG